MRVRVRVLGPENLDTLTSMNNLAATSKCKAIRRKLASYNNKFLTSAAGCWEGSTPTRSPR